MFTLLFGYNQLLDSYMICGSLLNKMTTNNIRVPQKNHVQGGGTHP